MDGRCTRAERRALGRLLVAATAAAGSARAEADELESLIAGARIEGLPALASAHRVEGCVHESLGDLPSMSRSVLTELCGARSRAVRSHLFTTRALGQIGGLFDDAGIPWLVMKGPVLSAGLYRDAGLRSYVDLDLLVPRHRFVPAVRALETAGFEHLVRNWLQVRHFRAGELALAREVAVDLHWDVFYAFYDRRQFALEPDALLERARTVTISGVRARTLDEVDTLLHLAVHATRSGANRLVWLKDIERAVTVGQPNLDELVRRARATRCGLLVGVALHRARSLLDAPVPAEVIHTLLGRGWRAVDRLVTTVSAPQETTREGSLARFVARTTSADTRSSVKELGRIGYYRARSTLPGKRGDRLDPDHAGSLLYAAGTEADKQAYLEWVATP